MTQDMVNIEQLQKAQEKITELTVENDRLNMELRDARRELSKHYKDEATIDWSKVSRAPI